MLAHCGIPWEQGVLAFHRTQRTVATASLAQARRGAGWLAGGAWGRWGGLQAPACLLPVSSVALPMPVSICSHVPPPCLLPTRAQVRQQLYGSSVGRFRRYARQLAPLLRPLRQLILRYEREAGLEPSAALLEQVLGPEEEAGGGAAAGGGGGGGGGAPAEGSAASPGSGGGGDRSSSSGSTEPGRDELR